MLKLFTSEQLFNLSSQATENNRRRAHLNVHDNLEANVQRLFIAFEPDSYIRPHRHPESHKWEFVTVLTGELDLLIFNNNGDVQNRITLSPSKTRSVEISPNIWHSYVCNTPDTIMLEIKEGSYSPTKPEDFAPWSPPEGDEKVTSYLQWLNNASAIQ